MITVAITTNHNAVIYHQITGDMPIVSTIAALMSEFDGRTIEILSVEL